jgi:hypothetical protein
LSQHANASVKVLIKLLNLALPSLSKKNLALPISLSFWDEWFLNVIAKTWAFYKNFQIW